MMRRLAFVVGDTAGHVNPALAVAEEYRTQFNDVDVLFLAAEGSSASELIATARADLALVPALPLARTGPVGRLEAMARIAPCIAKARRILAARGSRLAIGSGGYASGSVLLAARLLALQTAVIEPNVELGLANRMLRRIVRRAYVSHGTAAAAFPGGRALLTGTPVRQGAVGTRRASPCDTGARILITSGSRGDDFLAAQVPPLLANLQSHGIHLEVLHQSGARHVQALRDEYARLCLTASVIPRLDAMGDAYEWATFAITRAGAGTLAELALAGLPSMLVPLADAAANHQAANAAAVASAGAAFMVPEHLWCTGAVAGQLAAILTDRAAWQSMSQRARSLATPEAARLIVGDCEIAMRGRW